MRLLSNIYKGTMYVIPSPSRVQIAEIGSCRTAMNNEPSTAAPAQPARETMLDTDNMEV